MGLIAVGADLSVAGHVAVEGAEDGFAEGGEVARCYVVPR